MKEQHSTRTTGSLSLWSLSSSFAQKQNESQQEEKRSFLWSSSLYSKLAVYSLAVTSTAIFRFPEAVYTHGGALIVAYIILMLIVIQPLIYLELLLGQLYIRKLPVRSTRSIFKVCARGLSVTTAVLILLFIPNQTIVNLQSSSFIGSSSSTSNFEWCSCEFLKQSNIQPNQNNDGKSQNKYLAYYNSSNFNCLDQNDYSKLEELKILNKNPVFALDGNPHGQFSTVLYFKQEILNRRSREIYHKGLSNSLDYIWNYVQWKLILSGFFSAACIVLFSFEWKFQNVLSKILLWTTISFPVALVGLLLFQLDVSGRVYMVVRLMSFNWRKFADIKLWFEAVRLAILTSSVGLGLHTSISSSVRMSYRKFYQISWMFIVFILATVFVSTVLLFSEIEILTMLSGTQNPKSTVDTIPNYSTSIFASIFCKQEFGGLKIMYWIFYLLRIVATTRIQVLAVDTILRTLAINDITMHGRKLLRFFLRLAFIGLMQFGMTIPYMLKGSEKLLHNFYLFSGAWPISILLLAQALYFSKFASVTMLEEDLYLSYRIRFPKIFAFEQKTFLTFTGVLASVLLLTCEMIVNLVDFATGKVRLVLCDWPILYGISLNILPFFIFLACLLYELGITSNHHRRRHQHQKHKNTESCSLLLNSGETGHSSSVTLSRRNRPDKDKKEKVKPYYPWQEEMSKESFNSFYMNQDTHSQVTRATVESSRLRRPSVDNLGNLIPDKNHINLDPGLRQLCDCPEASEAKGSGGCPHTIMDYPDGTEEFPYVSTFREWKDGRYRKRHRVIRPIRRRRAPLPPIWSPGGLGDFSLYNAHVKHGSKVLPPGPDAAANCQLVSTTPVMTNNVAIQAELISSSDNNNNKHENSVVVEIPPPPPPPPLAEYSNIEHVESSSSFPPPPTFLLELGIGTDSIQDYKVDSHMEGDHEETIEDSFLKNPDNNIKTNPLENSKNDEQEQVQEIFTVIEELEQVLGDNKKTTNSNSDSPSDNNHGDNIDLNMEMDVNFGEEKHYTGSINTDVSNDDTTNISLQPNVNENEDGSITT